MISYVVEFAILHLLFFGIYKLMLSKETQLGFLRFFLVGSTLLSLALPAIEIPTKANIPTISADAFLLPVIEAPTTETSMDLPWYMVLLIVISIAFTFKLIVTLLQIYGWYRQSEVDSLEEIVIRKVSGLQNSFTFLKWIFIDPKNFENPADIIRHEQGHAKKLHSLDLLFFHVLTIFFWWLPSVWLMIRELKTVHEFEADEHALKIDNTTYTKTLVQCTLKAHGMDLASSFDDAPIFNRLNFMKKMKKKISVWKVASIATMVAVSGAMFACEEELEAEIGEIIEESNQQIEHTDEIQKALDKLRRENPNIEYIVIETEMNNKESLEKLEAYDPDQIELMHVDKREGENKISLIVEKTSKLFEKTVELQEQRADEVFTIVEKPASFKGGTQEFYKYIMENMEYPRQAEKLGIEGNVIIQFIVETDGSITNVEVVKGIGAGCDAEAKRIIEESPNWNPGSQNGKIIRQKMLQKLSFKLPS